MTDTRYVNIFNFQTLDCFKCYRLPLFPSPFSIQWRRYDYFYKPHSTGLVISFSFEASTNESSVASREDALVVLITVDVFQFLTSECHNEDQLEGARSVLIH